MLPAFKRVIPVMVASGSFASGSFASDSSGSYGVNPAFHRQAEAIRQRSAHQSKSQVQARKELAPRNVMEALVEEEVDLQWRQLTEKQRTLIQRSQVMAHALNHLPALYVTSAKGWRQQWVHGKNVLQKEISMTVRRALIAVQQDPLRAMSPVDGMPEVSAMPMAQLRKLLQDPGLDWMTLVPTIQRLLVEGKMNFPDDLPKRSPADPPKSANTADPQRSTRDQIFAQDDAFDWESHPLHQRG